MAVYTIQAVDMEKPEGDEGLTQFRFLITRQGAFGPDVEFERVHLKLDTPGIDLFDGFSFSDADGRIFGRDGTRLGVVFNPGETQKIITVSVRGDLLVEDDDLLKLTLTSYGEMNVTEGSVNARGINVNSAFSWVRNDDAEADHVAEEFHVDLILKDGVVDDYEREHILNPPDAFEILQERIKDLNQHLFGASKDGEFDQVEVAALDDLYLGRGIDDFYLSARDAELEAAEFFDPPADVSILAQLEILGTFEGLDGAPAPDDLIEGIFLNGGDVSLEGNNLVIAGDRLDLGLVRSAIEVEEVQFGPDIIYLENGNRLYADVNALDLSDGTLVFDLDSANLGFAYRIYAAAYGRTPDEGGLRFWTDVLDRLEANSPDVDRFDFLADQFLDAAEFMLLYGENPTDEEYIEAMYQNVLDRAPDEEGYDFWLGGMEEGLDRADILIAFAESEENRMQTLPDLSDGIWVI